MGVVKRHQSVAPVKYFTDYISFVIVRLSGEGEMCDTQLRFILGSDDFKVSEFLHKPKTQTSLILKLNNLNGCSIRGQTKTVLLRPRMLQGVRKVRQ